MRWTREPVEWKLSNVEGQALFCMDKTEAMGSLIWIFQTESLLTYAIGEREMPCPKNWTL